MAPRTAKEIFSKNIYITPNNIRHYIGDHLLLHSRWWFYTCFSKVIINSSRLAAKGKLDNKEWIKASFQVLNHIEGCGGIFHIDGIDHIRVTQEPMVIVSNHMSTLETVIFPSIFVPFRPITFVVKESLVKGRVFGPIMRSRDPIVVSRTNPKEDFRLVMSKGKEILESGKSLVIFPQATRSQTFEPEKFNTLGVKLARKVGVKILPVAIKTDFWGDSHIIKGFGPLDREKIIYIKIGEPIEIKGNGKAEHQEIIQFIQQNLIQWNLSKSPI